MNKKILLPVLIVLFSFTSASFGMRLLKPITAETMKKDYGIITEVNILEK